MRLNTLLTAATLCTFLASAGFWLMDLGGNRKDSENFRSTTVQDLKAVRQDITSVATDLSSYKREQAAIMEGVKDNLAGIRTTLAVFNEKLLNDRRQDERLTEIESRLRKIETHP